MPVQAMRSGVVTKDCAKFTRVLSTVVGWCRICIAVSFRKTVLNVEFLK